MRYFFIFFGLLFNLILLGSITTGLMIFLLFSYYGSNLPTAEEIENYKPATLSRVYDRNGNILGTFGNKNRIYTPINDIPPLIKNAFISAEDKNFYQHLGYDPVSLLKAITDVFRGKKLRGASTITQQVMKNFLLSSERTGKRKVKEIILASRIEKVLSKNQILNVYLNEIYLGQGAYGVTAAAITYFDKKLDNLSVGEAAFLAALPKAPSFYHPIREKNRSIQRRNFVIKELYENGFISSEEAIQHIASDLITSLNIAHIKGELSLIKTQSYFTDAIRKSMLQKYGSSVLKTDGLTIRSTFNPTFQVMARQALQEELIKFDKSLGIYRGPIGRISQDKLTSKELIRLALYELDLKVPLDGWFFAVVNKVFNTSAEIIIIKKNNNFEKGHLAVQKLGWVKKLYTSNKRVVNAVRANQIFTTGDVIFVSWEKGNGNEAGRWLLNQVPEVQGAFMVMEPNSGTVLAMQGGFSYALSPFNRALQAYRQPGSLFKPFVYLAALKNGFSPNSIIVDAPLRIKQASGIWRPKNSSNDWYGVAPLRKGLEYSRNLMTVRLAKTIGMKEVKNYAELFGLYENMPLFLSYSLGAGETTLFKLITAYSILANGGLEVEPTLFDLIQDRYGETIYKHGYLKCLGCRTVSSKKHRKPIFLNMAKRLVDPVSISQINSMLQGVVERGTASKTVGKIGTRIAGKTGTTNDTKDVWFIGYTPNIVAGCYIGYDIPRTLGNRASGGSLCGSVFRTFIENAFGKNKPVNWKLPTGAKVLNIDYNTGEVITDTRNGHIKEIFKNNYNASDKKNLQDMNKKFGIGQDLLFLDTPLYHNKPNKSFLRKSFGAIISGEQY